MNINTLFLYLSPFTMLALCGVITIYIGFQHLGRENNELQFFFGIPLLIFPLLAHWFIVNRCAGNAGRVWLAEGVLVAIGAFAFYRS